MKTARNPEPCASVATPNSSSAQARVRSGYRPSPGSGTRRMNHSSARPARHADRRAHAHLEQELAADVSERARAAGRRRVIRLAISAIPTGSFAPDSPSRMVAAAARDLPLAQDREHHRRVGRRDRGGHQQRDDTSPGRTRSARAARAAATVRNVPSTPDDRDRGGSGPEPGPADAACPPSNRMHTSATVTTRSTACCGGACSAGTTLTAMAAPTRTSAGEGILTRSVSRFDSTATRPTAAVSSTSRANGSSIGHDGTPPGRHR